ncbi:NAD(P)-binding protein [Pleurostoma richardsiae]|uniref:NAD(P)-binding protein n=1 Tax=Pleurostoma richardsiae TaxID=41990 RepID=A0AA38RCA9_9PEZI|nr:NAD(P)-binding protein [Pleurostoma richardsiae]
MPSPLDQVFPPKPQFTDKELPDQTGKVFLVTGSTSGMGLELAKILYGKNATVYVAARSPEKIKRAISTLKAEFPQSMGRAESLLLDLSDLATVAPAARQFMARETRLDVLFHNAGVMLTPLDARSAQGHELRMATNCLGPHLLSRCLEPLLVKTAQDHATEKASVRVVWVSSFIAYSTPKGGIIWDEKEGAPKLLPGGMDNYMESKVGDVWLARKWAEKLGDKGVINVSVNPGLMRTELQRNNKLMQTMMGILMKPAKYGAFSELFAGLSPQITADKNGTYTIPWGRFGVIPEDIEVNMKDEKDGGTGLINTFWNWCESVTNAFT